MALITKVFWWPDFISSALSCFTQNIFLLITDFPHSNRQHVSAHGNTALRSLVTWVVGAVQWHHHYWLISIRPHTPIINGTDFCTKAFPGRWQTKTRDRLCILHIATFRGHQGDSVFRAGDLTPAQPNCFLFQFCRLPSNRLFDYLKE